MSRVIKFRAWDSLRNEWYKASENDGVSPYIGFHVFGECTLLCPPRAEDLQHLLIQQFTGLTDKNGVEIYEGDILRVPAANDYEKNTFNCFEVFYHDNDCIGGENIGFCMNRMHCHGNSAGGRGYKFTPGSIETHGFVVIGNIYENPELLK